MSDGMIGRWFTSSQTITTHGVDIDLPCRAGYISSVFEALLARRTMIVREQIPGRSISPVEVTVGSIQDTIRMAFTVTTRQGPTLEEGSE